MLGKFKSSIVRKIVECRYVDNLGLKCFVFFLLWWNRFWLSLMVGIDWWDVVGCTQSVGKHGIGEEKFYFMLWVSKDEW